MQVLNGVCAIMAIQKVRELIIICTPFFLLDMQRACRLAACSMQDVLTCSLAAAVWPRDCTDNLQCSEYICSFHLGRCAPPVLLILSYESRQSMNHSGQGLNMNTTCMAMQLSSSTRTSRVFQWLS